MDSNNQETWTGLTGAQVRRIIQDTEQKAQSAINTVNTVVQRNSNNELKIKSEYLPSYVDDVIEGYYNNDNNKFYTNSNYSTGTEITAETGKIYVDLETNHTYRWSGSTYTEISSGDEIQQRLNNFNTNKTEQDGTIEGVVNNKVDKDGDKVLSTYDYDDDEKNKFTIVDTLPSTGYTNKVYYLKKDNNSYSKGLYYHDETKWQRVGGLL